MVSLTRSAGRYINRLAHFTKLRIDRFSAQNGITYNEGRTLQYIVAQGRTLYQRDIEEEYGVRPATASQLLKQMEKDGLIRREVDEHDTRMKKIIVTDKIPNCRQQVIDSLTLLEEELTAGIEEEKLEIFFEVMEKMMENMSEEKPDTFSPRALPREKWS